MTYTTQIIIEHDLDHAPYVVLTNEKGDTYTSYSEELIDFLSRVRPDLTTPHNKEET